MSRSRIQATVLILAGVCLFGVWDAEAGRIGGIKRSGLVKPDHTLIHGGVAGGTLVIKFADDLGISVRQGHLYHADGRPVEDVERLLASGEANSAAAEFDWDKSVLRQWRDRGRQRTGASLADLSQYFRLSLGSHVTAVDAAALCDQLNRSAFVELAFLESIPEVAGDIAPGTPDFEPTQDYLKPAPVGVNAYAAWSYAGGRGEGVTICDIEFGWQTLHEDLSKLAGHVIGGDPGPDNHGTAVMGEMIADSAVSGLTGLGYGVTGIAHGADARMVSVATRSTAAALLLAAANLSVGDIILIELHQPGPNSPNPPQGQLGYVPMEWTPSVFDAIQTITANGLIVCEAAGNGSENLNHASYGGWFDTTVQHSGAIMCGAGAPPSGVYGPDRSRLSFSNYGMRVDLQGYGNGVVTTGYGGLFDPGDPLQHYTATFSGTSSASPIVTASVACVQGRFKSVSGGYTLTAREIRDLLYATGSPQTGTTSQHIGPRPNLGAAMPLVVALSAYASPRTVNVSLITNPLLLDTLWLVNPHAGATLFDITLFDSLPGLPLRSSVAGAKARLQSGAAAFAAAAADWITVTPSSGSIPGGDSLPVELAFDANSLFGSYFGSYYKAQLNIEVDGDAGVDTLPVPIMALAQDSIHGDTVLLETPQVSLSASNETNMAGWDFSDSLTGNWLFDGSLVAGRVALGDTDVYRHVFANGLRWRGRDYWSVDSSWMPNYLIWRDSAASDDSVLGMSFEVWVPAAGDSTEFVLWRSRLYSYGQPIPNLHFGAVADWDLPASIGANNFGVFDTTRQMVYQTGNAGYENNAAGFALIRGTARGGVVGSNVDDVYPSNGFTDGRLYQQMRTAGFRVDSVGWGASNGEDAYTLLTAGYDLVLQPGEVMETEIAVLSSRTGTAGLQAAWARARELSDSLRYLTCPIDVTGDFNVDGILNSADIILTVNYVFKNGPDPQPLELAADVNCSGQVTSADIIMLVNHVFKSAPPPCDACTLY